MPFEASARTAVIGDGLADARERFARATNEPLVDCDPFGGGTWVCASFDNPTLQDVGASEAPPVADAPEAEERPPLPPRVPAPGGSGRVAVYGDTIAEAQRRYAAATTLPRVDCDPFESGWLCASFDNPRRPENSAAAPGPAATRPPPASPNVPTPPTAPTGGNALPGDSLFERGDLLSLQYDSCPDPDDIHAAVAGKMVVDHYGLRPGQDYIVVNGTCGYDRSRGDFIENSPRIFDELYGARGSSTSWFDAFGFDDAQERRTAGQVAARFRQTLDAGGQVYVLDGGPMDFTSNVVRRLLADGFGGDLNDIKLIQHSHGWNERQTDDANVAYLSSRVDYLRIDNGNLPNNRTPQLAHNNRISDSRYPRVDGSIVARFRNDAVYGRAWRVAFDLLDPNSKLDGSDTVELLWALGIGSDEVRDWQGFADTFLSGRQRPGPTPPSSTPPSPTPPPPAPADTGEARLLFQAEAGTRLSGSGWNVERALGGAQGGSYVVWRGADKFRATAASPPAGILAYDFVVTDPGVYQFTSRTQARVGNGGAASDKDNDAWVRFTSGSDVSGVRGQADKWTKFFTSGGDESWKGYSSGEQYDPTFFTAVRRFLPAGTHRVLVGGRSARFAIDNVGIRKVD